MFRRTRAGRERIKLAKEAAREAQLELRQKPPLRDIAWAAGLFEGEGSVGLHSNHQRRYSRLRISVTSTDIEIVEFFHERWGGTVRSCGFASPRANEAFVWMLQGPATLPFLLDLLPEIRRQRIRERFAIAIESQKMRRMGVEDPAYHERLQELQRQLYVLNKRGREPHF
jgi:hypothetical protein